MHQDTESGFDALYPSSVGPRCICICCRPFAAVGVLQGTFGPIPVFTDWVPRLRGIQLGVPQLRPIQLITLQLRTLQLWALQLSSLTESSSTKSSLLSWELLRALQLSVPKLRALQLRDLHLRALQPRALQLNALQLMALRVTKQVEELPNIFGGFEVHFTWCLVRQSLDSR